MTERKQEPSHSNNGGNGIGRVLTDNLHLLHALMQGEADGDRRPFVNNNNNSTDASSSSSAPATRAVNMPAPATNYFLHEHNNLLLLELQKQQQQQQLLMQPQLVMQPQWQQQQHQPNQATSINVMPAGQADLRTSLLYHDHTYGAVGRGGPVSSQEHTTAALLNILVSSLIPVSTNNDTSPTTSSIPRSISIPTPTSAAVGNPFLRPAPIPDASAPLAAMNEGLLAAGPGRTQQEQLALLLLSRLLQADQNPFSPSATTAGLVNSLTPNGAPVSVIAPPPPAAPPQFLPMPQTPHRMEGLLDPTASGIGVAAGGVRQGILSDEFLAVLSLQRQQQQAAVAAASVAASAILQDPALLSSLLSNNTAAAFAATAAAAPNVMPRRLPIGHHERQASASLPVRNDTWATASVLLGGAHAQIRGNHPTIIATQQAPMEPFAILHDSAPAANITLGGWRGDRQNINSSNSRGSSNSDLTPSSAGNKSKMNNKRGAPSSPDGRNDPNGHKPAQKKIKTGEKSRGALLKMKHQPKPFKLTNRPPVALAIATDDGILSPYQVFLRKQIQVFETTSKQLGGKAQGRNTPIVAGQIGIQCKYCANKPSSECTSGSIFYSHTLSGLYQIAQNMCKTHFLGRCTNIPVEARQRLEQLQKSLNRGSGGKQYWKDAAAQLGIIEDDSILKFTPDQSVTNFPQQETQSKETTTKWTQNPANDSFSPVSSQKRRHLKQQRSRLLERDNGHDNVEKVREMAPSSMSMPSRSNSSTSEIEETQYRKPSGKAVTNSSDSSV